MNYCFYSDDNDDRIQKVKEHCRGNVVCLHVINDTIDPYSVLEGLKKIGMVWVYGVEMSRKSIELLSVMADDFTYKPIN